MFPIVAKQQTYSQIPKQDLGILASQLIRKQSDTCFDVVCGVYLLFAHTSVAPARIAYKLLFPLLFLFNFNFSLLCTCPSKQQPHLLPFSQETKRYNTESNSKARVLGNQWIIKK
jgi:hypothetical protein